MSGEALGGGVMVAVAAGLWVTYLMPTWSRRRQFLATERNAVRLQQSLRILAETAEVPRQVRLEANARTVIAQQRLLAQFEEEARVEAKAATDAAAAARRVAAVVAATAAGATPSVVGSPSVPLRRLRKWRALCSLVLLVGVVSVGLGILPLVVSGSWTVLGVGMVSAFAALGALSRLARAARKARVVVIGSGAVSVAGRSFEPVQLDETPTAPQSWTPQPLPRPLYLSRGSIAQSAMASVDAAAELRKAAAEAELGRRAAQLASDVTPITRPAVARAETRPVTAATAESASSRSASGQSASGQFASSQFASSRFASSRFASSQFASMGIVGETEPGMTDLDAVLRRRRAVG